MNIYKLSTTMKLAFWNDTAYCLLQVQHFDLTFQSIIKKYKRTILLDVLTIIK